MLWILSVSFLLLFGGSFNPLGLETQLERRLDPPSLLEPDNPEIKELNTEFTTRFQLDTPRNEMKNNIESPKVHEITFLETFILTHVKYGADITQYLTIDHLATTTEVLDMMKDDCDGRAILTTSLLLHRGYDAWVVVAWTHWWVEVLLEGSTLQILKQNYRASKSWYMKFNATEIVVREFHMIGFVFYNFFLAALIPFLLPRLYNVLPQNTNVRFLLRCMFLFWTIPIGVLFMIHAYFA